MRDRISESNAVQPQHAHRAAASRWNAPVLTRYHGVSREAWRRSGRSRRREDPVQLGNLYASLHGGYQNCECCRGGCVPPTPLPGRGFDPQSGGGRNPPFLTTHTFYGKTIKSMVHMSNRSTPRRTREKDFAFLTSHTKYGETIKSMGQDSNR
jgi:hypothetical protein